MKTSYRLIKTYPGSRDLGYILEQVKNGQNKPNNYYLNGNWLTPSEHPDHWQEIKELTLLEEAKLRYPIGTKFKSVQYDSGIKISNNNIYEEIYIHLPIIYCDGTTIYYNDQWAEIIDDFVLPEKWCIKQNTAKEVCDWFNKNGTSAANINGSWKYLNYPYIDDYYSNEIKPGYTEITFEQFKKHVLKEETTVNVEEKVVEKDYEILSFISCIECIFNKNSKNTFGQNCILYEDLINDKNFKIHSVKRLSDGEIFTIGDKVFSEYVNYTINKISIVNDKCMVSALYDTNNPNGSRLHYNLKNLKKAKQPLFTTEDSVDIYEGDNLYSIDNMLNIKKHLLFNARYDDNTLLNNRIFFNSDYKHFSTREAAEEYILMNKPCLSLSDVWDNLKVKDQKEVMKFVKSKLNK